MLANEILRAFDHRFGGRTVFKIAIEADTYTTTIDVPIPRMPADLVIGK